MRYILRTTKRAFVILLCVFIFTSCSLTPNPIPDFELYTGPRLKIGVIGKVPNIKEININFVPLSFSDLEKQKLTIYDGIFITKEHLSEAAESKYATIYTTSNTPFFFFETEKAYLPFVDPQMTYEDAITIRDQMYVHGYIQTNNITRSFAFGLYSSIENEKTVQNVFSRIFMAINEIKLAKRNGLIWKEDYTILFPSHKKVPSRNSERYFFL
jgi:hypothetical protein